MSCNSDLIGSLVESSTYLGSREIGYLLQPVRITMTKSLPKISIGEAKMEETTEGMNLEVKRWIAEILVELGFAQINGESFEIDLFKALSRERMQKPEQLSSLHKDFYLKAKRQLEVAIPMDTKVNSDSQTYEKLVSSIRDLIDYRTGKLLTKGTSKPTPDVLEKLTPEERLFLATVNTLVESWRDAVLAADRGET